MIQMRSVESYIARRYLLTRRNVRFVNVIGLISILGITIGVAALLVALSVFNGFNSVVTKVLVGFDPHLRIERRGGLTAGAYDSTVSSLRQNGAIRGWSPFVSGKAMLVTHANNRVVFLRGVEEATVGTVSGLADKIVLGKMSLADSSGTGSIVIGLTLADRLGAVVGDRISVVSPYGLQSMFSSMSAPELVTFTVSGIFESDNKEYDGNYAFISLPVAQRLFHAGGVYHGIDIRLHDFNDAPGVKADLAPKLGRDFILSTWYELHESLYSVMKIERWSAYLLLSLIVIVATFNMLGSLTMTVIEKRRDIAVLKAMGMTTERIVRIFMLEGMLIGIAGTLAGIVLGGVVLWLQVQYHLFPLDPTVYIIPAIPVEVRWTDFAAIGLASLGCSFLAAYSPARRAARTTPAEALRWE
jgi:lipoprotein-releasing system permease protein